MERPTFADVRAAQQRLAGIARVTPLHPSETLSRLAGRPVLLKAENLQRTGSFKIRGAYNTLAQLSQEHRAAGVITASAGNHGQALAWAARELQIPATIVVPQGAPMAKVDAARGYGASVELAGEGFDEAVAIGDTVTFEGDVCDKRLDDGNKVVDCRVRGINQRGELVCLSDATMMLPA